MTPETQRALERLPARIIERDGVELSATQEGMPIDVMTPIQWRAVDALRERSPQLLETLDTLIAAVESKVGLCANDPEMDQARALLRETTRAMLSEK